VPTSFDRLVVELRGFREKREITKAMSKGIRKGAGPVRARIRKAAISTLPSSGGLNKWVAAIRINLRVKTSGRTAGVTLVGGRNSAGDRSDINAIDRGRVRAPSWGRRYRGSWHTQTVPSGFFTQTAAEAGEWRQGVDDEVDKALDQLRRG
jgi:hypothetical protein